MRISATEDRVFATAAGPRLRCFLEPTFLVVALLAINAARIHAQVDCFGQPTMVLSAIQRRVYDQSGVPIPKADVQLLLDDKPLVSTTTDGSGRFDLWPVGGKYWLRVRARGFTTVQGFLHIRSGIFSHFHPNTFWLVLGVGDDRPCPSASSSRKEFARMINANPKRSNGIEEDHATQK